MNTTHPLTLQTWLKLGLACAGFAAIASSFWMLLQVFSGAFIGETTLSEALGEDRTVFFMGAIQTWIAPALLSLMGVYLLIRTNLLAHLPTYRRIITLGLALAALQSLLGGGWVWLLASLFEENGLATAGLGLGITVLSILPTAIAIMLSGWYASRVVGTP
ncbi:hypothetical protein SAMN05660964_01714 [Thiothrix caldifontis]|uniref:Uncharacterized protein n=1 Tax=Thiothrix caldifontis TaxID=525918 RepID=A0A1H4BMT3_9GAMM|nr:hypothetical protein [Thiothrix caldifontis]SEA49132.1 hypothetical protein SAMN05660964_01714 [Thiothrix caldifontis]